MTTSMRGKVVLVTGAARGVGAEMSRRLAARGATMSLVGMEPERLRALAAELGDRHIWFECDVTDQRALDAAVSGTVAALGAIDIVVANAGIASHGTVSVADVEALARVINVNLIGVLRTAHATLPHVVASKGYMLLIASVAAFTAMPGLSAYAASKAGVEQLANVLRLELQSSGVDVGCAYMSWVDTDMVRDVRRDIVTFDDVLKRLPGPLGKITSLSECAELLVGAVESRADTVFVPGSVKGASVLRMLLSSRLVRRLTRASIVEQLKHSEEQMRQLGRSFGEHSVGMGESSGDNREQ